MQLRKKKGKSKNRPRKEEVINKARPQGDPGGGAAGKRTGEQKVFWRREKDAWFLRQEGGERALELPQGEPRSGERRLQGGARGPTPGEARGLPSAGERADSGFPYCL